MKNGTIINRLWNDEAGFIISAELVLVSTIVVLGMIVGLTEVRSGINQELEDVGSAFAATNQGFHFNGDRGHKGESVGSFFNDLRDACDGDCDVTCDSPPQSEW